MAVEHQMLSYDYVLSYQTKVDDKMVPNMLSSIKANISVIDLKICGNIIITKHDETTEFLIPVDRKFEGNQHYVFKPGFKLVNAVRQRYYGNFDEIDTGLKELNSYISEQSLTPITSPYIMEIDSDNGVYDIFIGISENVL